MKRLTPVAVMLPATLFSGPALAHPGDHSGIGALHLLTAPDHLAMIAPALALAAAVIVALALKSAARR